MSASGKGKPAVMQYIGFALIFALGICFIRDSIAASIITIAVGALLLPQVRMKMAGKPIAKPSFSAVAIIFVLLVSLGMASDGAILRERAATEQRLADNKIKAEAAKKQRLDAFNDNPQIVIDEIKGLMTEERYAEAHSKMSDLLVSGNQEIISLNDRAIEAIDKAAAIDREKAVKAKIADHAVIAMTPDQYPRAAAAWGAGGLKKLNDIQVKVAEKAAQSGECDRVDTVGLSESRSVPKKSAVFYVDCLNGKRFYISDADIEAGKAAVSKQAQTSGLEDASAIEACRKAVQVRMNYPSTFKSSIFNQGVYRAPGGNVVATIDFKGKNGFGAELPMTARCVFDERGMSEPEISHR